MSIKSSVDKSYERGFTDPVTIICYLCACVSLLSARTLGGISNQSRVPPSELGLGSVEIWFSESKDVNCALRHTVTVKYCTDLQNYFKYL